MATKIFINLAVDNPDRSAAFFSGLGFTFNPQYTDENATCMIIAENIFAMLIAKNRFKDFTKKEICDTSRFTEVLLAIDAESREKVDEMAKKALATGGSVSLEPQDQGWMYSQSFNDPDGHQWEIFYMNENTNEQVNDDRDLN